MTDETTLYKTDPFVRVSVIANMADDDYVKTVKHRFRILSYGFSFFLVGGLFVSYMVGWWMVLYHAFVSLGVIIAFIHAENLVIKVLRLLMITSHKLEDGIPREKI